nr:hypothetical protein CFP56_74090 [Quercus suber]
MKIHSDVLSSRIPFCVTHKADGRVHFPEEIKKKISAARFSKSLSMEIKTARRGPPQGKESSVFDRLGAGRGGHLNNSSNKICKFWLSGRLLTTLTPATL